MECKSINRYKMLIFIPLVLGILIDNISFISRIYVNLFWVVSILFIIFWFWTGKVFARSSKNKIKGFCIGNSLLVIFFAICIWVYLPGPRARTNAFLEAISRYYVIGMMPVVSKIVKLFMDGATGGGILKAAYVFMFMIFLIGFSYELFAKKNKKRIVAIIFLFNIIFITLMNVLMPYWTHVVGDHGTFVKESSEEIKSYYSAYSTVGLSMYLDLQIKDGKVDWQIIDPKGKVIFAGFEVKKDGKLYHKLTYPENYEEGYYIIKPPNVPGKYTLIIKPSKAIGEYDVNWEDVPAPLM